LIYFRRLGVSSAAHDICKQRQREQYKEWDRSLRYSQVFVLSLLHMTNRDWRRH